MKRFQKLAISALISVLLLLFVGAIVRATGSGLGCPDWPTCWGKLVPPTRADQVDFEKINLEKFRRKAERFGRDPAEVTRESLRAEFNPIHTWVEYINRLCAMPVGILSLALMIASFWRKKRSGIVCLMSVSAFALVLVNAELGRRVVLSGLKPGMITLHVGLAIILLCVLVYVSWKGCADPARRVLEGRKGKVACILGVVIFALTVAEGVLGAQVRELTDELAINAGSDERALWTRELEKSGIYLIHRSFSWLIVIGAGALLILLRQSPSGIWWPDKMIGFLVGSLLVMGVLLAHVGILPVVQVLHVGAAALLVSVLFFWVLATRFQSS
ncbi:MAG: COX15/CtaA family protein [Roseibacillus sp.]|nr:COX15/CtaA family protein [Roseibacillus sp.]